MFKSEHKGVRSVQGCEEEGKKKGRREIRGGGRVEITTTDRANIEQVWEGNARPA